MLQIIFYHANSITALLHPRIFLSPVTSLSLSTNSLSSRHILQQTFAYSMSRSSYILVHFLLLCACFFLANFPKLVPVPFAWLLHNHVRLEDPQRVTGQCQRGICSDAASTPKTYLLVPLITFLPPLSLLASTLKATFSKKSVIYLWISAGFIAPFIQLHTTRPTMAYPAWW